LAPLKAKSNFSRVFKYNSPKYLIFVGCFFAGISGACNPIFGVIFSKVMTLLTVPLPMLVKWKGEDYLMEEMSFWCIMILFVAIATMLGVMFRTIAFGKLGENLTYSVRSMLYLNILEKNIGFHDERDHNASVLSASLGTDSAFIYACTENVGPYMEAFFALATGLVIGFYYCW